MLDLPLILPGGARLGRTDGSAGWGLLDGHVVTVLRTNIVSIAKGKGERKDKNWF